MNKNLIILFSTVFLLVSCQQKKGELTQVKENEPDININQDSEGYTLLKSKCYACHSVISESHDGIIAPPMAAVKMRYSRIYRDKQSFVNAFADWATDPKQENAIMRGAVAQFNVMPNQNFKEEEIKKIAAYIFENEIEQPSWFQAHSKQMHGGKGKGMGMGKK